MTQSDTAAGEWVAVPLADGTARYDWQPAEQPPSPDGTVGVWRLVPGEVDGFGSWAWFPTPAIAAASEQPFESAPAPRGRARLRWIAPVVVLVVVGMLFAFTRGAEQQERTGVSTMPTGQKQTGLLTAANAYTDALVAGNGDAAASYLDPKACQGRDLAGARQLAAFLSQKAPGATVRVTAVDVSGDDGNVTGYEFSSGVPQDVQAVIEQGYTSGGDFSWHLRGQKWVFDAEC